MSPIYFGSVHGLSHLNYIYKPSWSLPFSAAWPVGKIVLTKMPILPLGESLPPTIEKPKLFLPGPFSKMTVWNDAGTPWLMSPIYFGSVHGLSHFRVQIFWKGHKNMTKLFWRFRQILVAFSEYFKFKFYLRTFMESSILGGLTRWQNSLDKNAHASFRWISSSNNWETQTLFTRSFFKNDSVKRCGNTLVNACADKLTVRDISWVA